MDLLTIKQEIRNGGYSVDDLNNLMAFIRSVQTDQAKDSISVGDSVWVVQKTKRTSGVVTKVNIKKAQVDMRGRIYNVPLSMLEVQ